jgi:hypothetical protein
MIKTLKLCAGWVFLLTLLFYLPTAASTVQEADSAQFLALGNACLNHGWPLAHPPGYPLFTGISCGAAWIATLTGIPTASILSWISAIFAATAASVAFHILQSMQSIPGDIKNCGRDCTAFAALITVALVFFSVDVWRTATLQEPLGLAILTFITAMLLPAAAIIEKPSKSRWIWAITGLSFGLALANHHTTAIALPATLWLLCKKSQRQHALIFATAAMAGAVPVLRIFHEAFSPTPFTITTPGKPGLAFDWMRFLHPQAQETFLSQLSHAIRYLLRSDFGTFALAQHPASATMGAIPDAMRLFLTSLPENIGWIGVAIAALGAVSMARNWKENLHWFLTAGTAVFFVMLIRLPVNNSLVDIIRRQLAIALLAMIPFLFRGFSELFTLTTAKIEERSQKQFRKGIAGYLFAALALLSIANIGFNIPKVRRDLRNFPERHFKHALEILPPGSLAVAASDDHVFGFSYAQTVLGVRPDVRILNLLEWTSSQQKKRALTRTGIDAGGITGPALETLNRGEIIQALSQREPVWIIDPPRRPWPDFLNKAICASPWLVLDMRSNRLDPDIARSIRDSAASFAKPDPGQLWLALDHEIASQYRTCP